MPSSRTGPLTDGETNQPPDETPGPGWFGSQERGASPPMDRETALGRPLADLAGLWLVVRCGCGRKSAELLPTGDTTRRLRELMPRLRCLVCGQEPYQVVLRKFTKKSGRGAAEPEDTGWELRLV